ncbi:cytochrome b N-terminal domain-containing protein [Saccharicrinis sp. FJH54]|uniref:cytochrome b N-terminal domain-containing protein n=1 Tax=Saccharicrinis sp. FJH54 TaxID=3344665 RepID=UPI0035D40D2E
MNKLKQLWSWIDDRTGITETLDPLKRHLVPHNARWAYVFGSATLFAFLIQVITGVALALLYQPTTDNAYDSLKYITNEVPLGSILRGLHYFGASAMIILVGIHMIRVYIFAAFKYPREMSWISGVVLLFLTIGMGFTGQLLRFDSEGIWGVVVAAQQAGRVPVLGTLLGRFLLGGETLGGATLSRFFAIHVFLIPAFIFGLLGLHLYLVIRNGISEPPKAGRLVKRETYRNWYKNLMKKDGVPFWPNAAWRDMAFGIFIVFIIFIFATFVGPPEIGNPPDPTNINTNPRPDWYLLWIFAMFALIPRSLESYAIILLPLIGGLVLFALPIIFNTGERSPWRRPWSIGIVATTLTAVGVFWYIGVQAPWSPRFDAKPLTQEVIGDVSPKAQKGAELFHSKACIYCHKISGNGGIHGPDLTDVGNRLNRDQLTLKIVNGGKDMPAFGGTLSKDELDELVTFLKTRKKENSKENK